MVGGAMASLSLEGSFDRLPQREAMCFRGFLSGGGSREVLGENLRLLGLCVLHIRGYAYFSLIYLCPRRNNISSIDCCEMVQRVDKKVRCVFLVRFILRNLFSF